MENLSPMEMINIILSSVLAVLLVIVARWIVKFIKYKLAETQDRIRYFLLKKDMKKAEDMVKASVISVSQLFVNKLKKHNKFDQSAHEEAFTMAKQRTLDAISKETQNLLKEEFGDLDAWLDNKIEYYCYLTKNQFTNNK